jgi:predicted lipase
MTIKALTDSELKTAAKFSDAAYSESIPGAFRYDSKLGTTAFLVNHNGSQWIIFRGTQEAKDWLMNLSAVPWRVGKRWVHGGFAMAQASVWKRIRKQLKRNVKIYCVGHSLGGACATVSALRLQSEGFKSVRLVTFGRPNVFLKSAKNMNLKCNVSVVSGSDIVATVPRIAYGPDGNGKQDIVYLANDGLVDYLNPSKEFRDNDRKGHLKEIVSDHNMTKSYIPRVEKIDLEELCATQ